jgi:hypothetical protein
MKPDKDQFKQAAERAAAAGTSTPDQMRPLTRYVLGDEAEAFLASLPQAARGAAVARLTRGSVSPMGGEPLKDLIRVLVLRCEYLLRRYGRDAVLVIDLDDAGRTKILEFAVSKVKTVCLDNWSFDLVEISALRALRFLRSVAA